MTNYVSGPTIATFRKNKAEEVRASVDWCDKGHLMNFRVYKWIKKYGWIATEKGLSMLVGRYTDLLRMVLAMGEHLKKVELLSETDCNAVQQLLGQYSGSWGAPPNEPLPDPPAPPPKRRPQRTVIGA